MFSIRRVDRPPGCFRNYGLWRPDRRRRSCCLSSARCLLFMLIRNGTDFVVNSGLSFTWLLLIPAPAAAFWWVTYDNHEKFMRPSARRVGFS